MDDSIIKQHFQIRDPIIFEALKAVDLDRWHRPPILSDQYFDSLVNQIISQQLNTKVADIISERLRSIVANNIVSPATILAVGDEQLRAVGLSKAKTSYIKNLAELSITNKIKYDLFPTASDEEVIAELVQVKGIGRWTAEMFLLFALGKTDIFSHGDYGLRSGIKNLYNLPVHPTIEQATIITDKWRPYRSFGSFALWQSLEKKE